MKIELKSGTIIEVGSIEELQDLYGQLHMILGERVKIIEKRVVVEKPSPMALYPDIYRQLTQRLSPSPMPKPIEAWCG